MVFFIPGGLQYTLHCRHRHTLQHQYASLCLALAFSWLVSNLNLNIENTVSEKQSLMPASLDGLSL